MFFKRNFVLFMIIFTGAVRAFSEVTLSNEQDGYMEEGEYLINSTITVKAGKTLSFAPGSIIRFKQYSGIMIYGTLKCAGTAGKPVVFTSNNHRPSSGKAPETPGPFDWNGITAADSEASIDFQYVRVAYGTCGIDIKSTASNIALKQVVFTENGRSSVTVAGKILDVKDNVPYFFIQPVSLSPVDTVKTAAKSDSAAQSVRHKKFPWKISLRIASGTIAVAGIAAGSYYYYRALKNQDSLDKSATTYEADSYQHKRNDARKYSTISSIVAVLGCAGFAVTFCF